MTTKYKDGDMIVGYRFQAPDDLEGVVRAGVFPTVVVDQMAIAGPIYYWCPVPTPTNGRQKTTGWAVCRGCRKMSGGSGRGNRSDAVGRWAHKHRCESGKRLDEMPNHPCGPRGLGTA